MNLGWNIYSKTAYHQYKRMKKQYAEIRITTVSQQYFQRLSLLNLILNDERVGPAFLLASGLEKTEKIPGEPRVDYFKRLGKTYQQRRRNFLSLTENLYNRYKDWLQGEDPSIYAQLIAQEHVDDAFNKNVGVSLSHQASGMHSLNRNAQLRLQRLSCLHIGLKSKDTTQSFLKSLGIEANKNSEGETLEYFCYRIAEELGRKNPDGTPDLGGNDVLSP